MKIDRKLTGMAAVAIGALAVVTAGPGLANHSWGSYHWERKSPEITIPVIDHTTSTWPSRVATAVSDWNQSIFIDSGRTALGDGATACGMVLNEIHVCNGDYGDNGWLGIASISVSRGRSTHIIAGSTKLNDYYFDGYPAGTGYNTSAWRQLVTCQEIGHDYGLGHQNEDFNTDATDSCMEYTYDPTNNTHPDFHDYDQLELIYAHDHIDGGTTSPGPGKGGGKNKLGVPGNGPAEWGQAIGVDAHGRANLYKREMAGYDIITHVTWTIEETTAHDHEDGPRQHSGDHYFNF